METNITHYCYSYFIFCKSALLFKDTSANCDNSITIDYFTVFIYNRVSICPYLFKLYGTSFLVGNCAVDKNVSFSRCGLCDKVIEYISAIDKVGAKAVMESLI